MVEYVSYCRERGAGVISLTIVPTVKLLGVNAYYILQNRLAIIFTFSLDEYCSTKTILTYTHVMAAKNGRKIDFHSEKLIR